MFRVRWLFIFVLIYVFVTAPSTAATNLPPNFVETVYVTNLSRPTAMRFAPDGRLFVLEQKGTIKVILPDGTHLDTPFISINTDETTERGLLGIAFDPDFATNKYIYLYYTPAGANKNRLVRVTANGNVAVAGSETLIMEFDTLQANIHNGGALNFGPDGKLYIAIGDSSVSSNAKSLNNRHGKILRINKDGSIPTDNPFYTQATGANRSIWALGLRNPFSFTIQPGTGRMFINDVGQSTWEEVNEGFAGANYGWPTTEGDFDQTQYPTFTRPVYAYKHENDYCAVIGSAFYNPPNLTFPADYHGDYFFGDYCKHTISRYDTTTKTVTEFASNLTGIKLVQIAFDDNGDLLYLVREYQNQTSGRTGRIYRIHYQATQQPPSIIQQPQDLTVGHGGSATFSCDATGTPPLNFKWQRNMADIQGATDKTYTIPVVNENDNGAKFRCVVSNSIATVNSNEATLTVTENTLPVAQIVTPAEGTKYNAGQTISFSGTGTDAEDGNLSGAAFTWEVVFHHDDHTHPAVPPFSGVTESSFEIPVTGHADSNVWYRIHLMVTDSQGDSHSVYRDIYPNLANLTLNTNPPGLQVEMDGQPQTAPYSDDSVVGVIRNIGVESPQELNGVTYTFESWSDGGSQSHDIYTPNVATTYTANFTAVSDPVNLLVNGDFETNANNDFIPDGWSMKNFDGSKVVCNKVKDTGEKIVAKNGECAFQTKSIGNSGKLMQKILTPAAETGSTLDLAAWVYAKNGVTGAFIDTKVIYADGTKAKLEIVLPVGSYDYQALNDTITVQSEIAKLKVRVVNPTTGGKFRLDDLKLTHYTIVSKDLIALP